MAFSRLTICAFVLCAVLQSFCQQSSADFNLRKLSSWPGYARGETRDIQVIGGKAYLAMGEGGLCIVDVQDATQPGVLGRLDLPGVADEIDVLNDLAFLACGTGGVHVINISNPGAPVRVAWIESPDKVLGISTLQPNFLFVAAGQAGVKAYNVSNPAAPALVATFNPGGVSSFAQDVESVKFAFNRNGIDYSRSLLAVASSDGGYLYDASNPANLTQIIGLTGSMVTVAKDESTLYFVNGSPQEIRSLDLLSIGTPGFPTFGRGAIDRLSASPRLKLYGGSGYVTSKSSSTPLNATYIAAAQSSSPFLFSVTNVAIHTAASTRQYDYLPDIFSGLSIYSSASSTFTPVSTLTVDGTSVHVRSSGNNIFVSDKGPGIHAFLLNTNKTLQPIATYDVGYTINFDVSDHYLYRLGFIHDFNAQVFDIADPAQPRLVANLASLLPALLGEYVFRNITVRNGRAYVSAISLSFFLPKIFTFDVSNPESPVFLAQNNDGSEEMQVVGQTLFTAAGGLNSYSIAADGTLKLIQSASVSSSPSNLKVIGNTAYLCAETEGLMIYDVSDPADMRLLSTYKTSVGAVGVDIVGTNAFVADARGGFVALDITDLTNPKLLAQQSTDNSVDDVKAIDGVLIAANGAEGVTVWKYGPGIPQTISFPSIPNKTVISSPFQISATASSGLPVTLAIVGPATLQGTKVTVTGVGKVTITATQAGDAQYNSATAEQSFNVTRVPQTIDFPEIPDKTTRSVPFAISATASSELPVSFTIDGPATLDDGIVTITGAGTVSIQASQDGNNIWDSVTLQRAFTVIDQARDFQTISLPTLTDGSIEDDPVSISITASSGLPVEVVITGPASIQNEFLKYTGTGTVTITASQAGNTDFAPVTVERIFTIRDLAGAVAAEVLARNPNLPTAMTLPDADPDHDGLPNIVEYILRSDPTSATSREGHTTASIIESAGYKYLNAHFLKPRTSKYPISVEVVDFSDYPKLFWFPDVPSYNADGSGDFAWPVANYKFPLIRLVVHYP
jgi:hypothetical protein